MVLVPRRAVRLVVCVALVAVVSILPAACGSSRRRAAARPVPPATLVTIGRAVPGRQVPFGFLGLSLEYSAIQPYAGTNPHALDPVFVQLVRNLVPGQAPVVRVGGDSADRAWWPGDGLVPPPGVTFAITPRWLAVTRALTSALRARLILDLNLEADSPQIAASEAAALLRGLGTRRVGAFELGNEPDLYGTFPWYRTPDGAHVTGRPPGYDMSGLVGDFTRFAAVLRQRSLAGPSLGAPAWTRRLDRFLTAEPEVRLVTLHRYPLQLCFTPRSSPRYPTLAHLLAPASSIGLADSFAPWVALARSTRRSVRIDELNSVSCGAVPGVSRTFASALWVLNTLFEMLRVGVHGVNVHTFPGAGYELFRIAHRYGQWRAVVAPEYYGLMLFARVAPAGSRLLDVRDGASGPVRTWATRSRDGTVRIVFVNTGRTARRLLVRAPGLRFGTGSLERLTAPGLGAGRGVVLAGQTFGPRTFTGRLAGGLRADSIAPLRGRYEVDLPAASAAMLVLSPSS